MRKKVCREKYKKCNPPWNRPESTTSIICVGSASLTTVDFFFFFSPTSTLPFWNIPRKSWKKPLKAYLPSSPGKTIAPKCLYKSDQRYPQARQPGLFYPEKKAKCIQKEDFHETVYREVWFYSQHTFPGAGGPLTINMKTQKYNPVRWE